MIDGDPAKLERFHTVSEAAEHYANLTIDKKGPVKTVNILLREAGFDFTGELVYSKILNNFAPSLQLGTTFTFAEPFGKTPFISCAANHS